MRRANGAGSELAGDGVTERLRQLIASAVLRPGDLVREGEVATRLGVSRTPVREAIARLVAEGLITKEGNRTAKVFYPSLQEIVEIYEIRMPLEILAARVAATRVDEAFSAHLNLLLDRVLTSDGRWIANHEEFHTAIFAQSGRAVLTDLLRSLRARSEPYIRLAVHADPKLQEQSKLDHVAISQALVEGDPQRVERLVRRHLNRTLGRLETLLSEDGSGWSGRDRLR